MNYACINQWDGLTWPDFYQKVINGNYEKVILFGQNEWGWYHQEESFYKTVEHCKQNNIPFEILTGACSENYPAVNNDVLIHWWDTYWIGKTYQDLICNAEHTGKPPKAIDPYHDMMYEHHFISMNSRPHRHRCVFIDAMAKHGLMDYGAISIHGENPDMHKWKYFSYTPMYLSDGKGFDQYKLPDQYYTSFAQLISESSDTALMLSEKTATPLILGKPFIVGSVPNFHRMLKRMGFELYDEIFDYGFDSEPDEVKRYDLIMKNFVRLSRIPLKNLRQLQRQIAPKIMHNRNRAKEITYDLGLYPQLALDTINYYKETGIELDHRLIQIHMNLERYKKVQF